MPDTWLFDLDNTLHNAGAHIFPALHRSMIAYIVRHLTLAPAEADALRIKYWQRYGATLSGLVRHHAIDPGHFLAETHRFEHLNKMIVFDRAVKAMLRRLPGRKIVFSNAPITYIETVLNMMGARALFDDIASIETLGYQPKPAIAAYRRILRLYRLNARRCIMVEDTPANLAPARRLGMRTVLVGSGTGRPAYVDVKITSFLNLPRVMGKNGE